MKAVPVALLLVACGPAHRPDGTVPDAAVSRGDSASSGDDGGDGAVVYVYAHTDTTLYKVNPDTLAITEVGDFVWPSGVTDQMTDIAIDHGGGMVGISFGSVYQIDPTNAHTTLLSSSLAGSFNGLSFVPADQIGQTGDDVLVGTRADDGMVFRIDPMTGAASYLGNMGNYTSSGDLCSVSGFGTVQTVPGGLTGGDVLTKLAPQTFAAMPIGTATGFGSLWGVAFWKGKIYGFSQNGQFILIDATTGVGTLVVDNGIQWWGAGVTTSAPIL
jgi:hypothetical protein